MSPPYVFGWNPSSPEGDVVDVPPPSRLFTFKLIPTEVVSSTSPATPAAPASPPPARLFGFSSQCIDTEKIPRPKNSFIIFRTEFARLHRNPRGSRSKTDVKVLGRTVSGKAADAWRELPPEQKQRYQRLAELEKEQHAREHPDYQYRPRRRGNQGSRRPTSPAAKRRRPSPAFTIRTARDVSSGPGSDALLSPGAEEPPSSPETEHQPLKVDPAVKADRRRSSSVPVTSGEHLYTSNFWGGEDLVRDRWDRPSKAKRRSRSVTQEWAHQVTSFQTPEPVFFDPRSPQNGHFSPSLYPAPFRALSPNSDFTTVDPATLFSPPQYMSPLTAVASSLAGWNGEATVPLAPMAPQPVRLNPPSWLLMPTAKYDSSPELEGHDPLTPTAGEFQWPLNPAGEYVFMQADDAAFSMLGKGESDPGDYARAGALQEYELGLQQRVHYANSPDFTFGLDPADELRY